MKIQYIDWLQAAHHEVEMRRWRDESDSKLKHFVAVNDFEGVTPEMFGWYFINRDSESYRLWHPAHIGLQWEKKIAGLGATWIGWEKIDGKMAAYRMRRESADLSPVSPKNKKGANLNIVLDTEEAPLFYILSEIEPTVKGIRTTTTFIFPAAFPDEYLEAHRQHYSEELPNMVYKAIPYLIKKTFGYIPDTDKLVKSELIVPPEL